jgi:hypothetical protein
MREIGFRESYCNRRRNPKAKKPEPAHHAKYANEFSTPEYCATIVQHMEKLMKPLFEFSLFLFSNKEETNIYLGGYCAGSL